MHEYQLLIDGEYTPALSGNRVDDINPSTGEVYASVHQAGSDDVEAVLASANEAFQTWKSVAPTERESMLLRAADLAEDRAEELRDVLIDEAGSTLLKESPGASPGLVGELENRGPVTIRFARSGTEAVWEPSAGTLLDLAEASGLRPAYSCRSGICGTCTTRVIEGDIAYIDPPLAIPEADNALICCSYPGAPGKRDGDGVITLDL